MSIDYRAAEGEPLMPPTVLESTLNHQSILAIFIWRDKKEHLERGERLTCNSGESPLPVSILPGETLSCGDNSSALPQLFPKSSLPKRDGCESACKVSESTLSTVSKASEHGGHRKKRRVVTCKVQVEQVWKTSNRTQVIKCSPEQKSLGSHPSVCLNHRELELSSQTPIDSMQHFIQS